MSKSLASAAVSPGDCTPLAGVVGLVELAEVGAGLVELAPLVGIAEVLKLVETVFVAVVFSPWVFTESGT